MQMMVCMDPNTKDNDMTTLTEYKNLTIDELTALKTAKQAELDLIDSQIDRLKTDISQHQYANHDDTENHLSDLMESWAFNDCEGAGNCGAEQYEQAYQITGEPDVYLAVIDVEYNRHDKTYYYIEECEYSWSKL